ncbi:hypothetical protein QAD02_002608 [Eretmocerus hayati]|uniref:Uncharacterized protein n=1 Tax=Eretmocerus hayati TaxID=131215 RepID=A0ACC2NJA5_9HYME|nr:hypothetical protein QAD02_002608 [Eretmocerus hayati]
MNREIPLTITRLTEEELAAIGRPTHVQGYFMVFTESYDPNWFLQLISRPSIQSPDRDTSDSASVICLGSDPEPASDSSSDSDSDSNFHSESHQSPSENSEGEALSYAPEASNDISYSPSPAPSLDTVHCSTCCSCESREQCRIEKDIDFEYY